MTDTFTTQETAGEVTGNFALLKRYLREVPFVRYMLIPNLVVGLVAALVPLLVTWGSGALVESGGEAASASFAGIGITITLATLAVLVLCAFILRAGQWISFESGGQVFAKNLIQKMVRGLGATRTTFFDEYPSGKIINRVVKDADSLRMMLPIRLGDTSSAIVELLVIAATVAFASPLAACLAIPTFLFFLYVQRNIAPILQKLIVLRSVRFGEVLHRETDLIEGVRCYALYEQLPALMRRLADAAQGFMQMHFLRGRIEVWGQSIAELGVAIYGSVILLAVYLGIHSGALPPVVGGVIITASFKLSGVFKWLTWSLGMLFETIGHARRVFEYVDLECEESTDGVQRDGAENIRVAVSLPDRPGDLEFKNYSMSYRENTPVILHGLNLRIKSGSKVGLVGRTGSGKTSFIQALFRMVYVREGDITVGGRSILQMPLQEARALFAVVPQDPYLFEGTLRSNIDRLHHHTDEEVRQAVRATGLVFDLDMPILEGGNNLSVGQRQLVCLARVILAKQPYVLLDEPTSGVDTITDASIQSVLREALADRTVITIAHRLETLARVDEVIDLSQIATEATRVVCKSPCQ